MLALARDMAAPDHPAEVCLVISNRPEAAGLARAAERGLPVAAVDHRVFGGTGRRSRRPWPGRSGRAGRKSCASGRVRMRVLTPGFTAAWEGRMLNVHPSILPLLPGLDTRAGRWRRAWRCMAARCTR